VDVAAADPLEGPNLMYTFHFYAGTHGAALRDKVRRALDRGAAVFCSEWGTSAASGTGGPYLDRADEWLAFLDEQGIGWVNWSLCNKNETSAALRGPLAPSTPRADGLLAWPAEQLSASGAYVRSRMLQAAGR
jgi:endoglucanase